MSHLTNESEDGVLSKDQTGSPLIDEGNSSGSVGGGVVLKKGPWTSSEDAILVEYVKKHGEGNWNAVQKHSGLFRCGKSCRLRWANHLRPNLKKGAFTAEEERLIIELHAKMGNKWARMAAHLPGRTDNEIKNYWNTRIKRRQRAGLPLYPPEVGFQSLPESQQIQNSGGVNGGDKVHHDLLQTNSYEIPDVILDGFKANQDNFPFVPEFPNLSANSMLMKGFSSSQYCGFMSPTMHRPKRVRESPAICPGYNERNGIPLFDQIQDDTGDKIVQSLGLPYPFDPDPTNKDPLPFSGMLGSHALLNGNSSASKPISGPVKLELPSLQYLETDLGGWGTSSSPPPLLESVDAFIQSPPSGLVQLECLSPRNSGLLDALLHEAKTISSGKNHVSDKSANSSTVIPGDLADSCLNMSETEWEDYGGDPISPLGHSTTSIFSECTPISASGSSLDEHPHAETFAGCSVKAEPVDQVWTPDGEKETSTQLDFSRPDVLLGSSWIDQSVGGLPKDQAMMNDAVATLFSDDFGNSYKNMAPGTPPTSSQGWGFGCCAWNNMPAVCQMSELP